MRLLRDVLEQAQKNGIAIGHFNISDLVLLKAVFDAARALNLPIVVGASQEERNFMGVRQIATLVQSLREDFDFSIFVNADHTHSLQRLLRSLEPVSMPSSSMLLRCHSRKTLHEPKRRSKP